MSRLAQAVLMDRTTLTRSIRPLERAGLLRVARSPEDARTKIVVVTRTGERMIESIFPVWERVLKQIKKSVGAEMLTELHARLDQVIALSPVAERDPPSSEGGASSNEQHGDPRSAKTPTKGEARPGDKPSTRRRV
jgi:hypothetical protein